MKKGKHFLVLFVCLLVSASMWAQGKTELDWLVVELHDGAQSKFWFMNKPSVACKDDELVVSTKTDTLMFELTAVKRLFLTQPAVGIEDVEADMQFRFSDQAICVTQLKEGEVCSVFDLQGRMVAQAKAGKDGEVRLATESLGKGVYVVKARNVSFKIKL